jgi:hypothetical protein
MALVLMPNPAFFAETFDADHHITHDTRILTTKYTEHTKSERTADY